MATASGVAAKQERTWVYTTTAAVAAGTSVRIAVTAEVRLGGTTQTEEQKTLWPAPERCASRPDNERRLTMSLYEMFLDDLAGDLDRLGRLIVRVAPGERWLRQERDALQRVVDGKMELLRTV